MIIVVRLVSSCSSASSRSASVSASSALVGSSRIRTGASLSRARAIDRRWRCPTGERRSAFTDDGLVALRETLDEAMGARRPRRRLDLGLARVWPAIGDVVGDREGEQERFLRDERDLLAQGAQLHVMHVTTVDRDLALPRIDK